MGKVVEKLRLANALEPKRRIDIDAVVDTGATTLVLPAEVVEKLHLRKIRDASVKSADNSRRRRV
jgi:predicted aspartyl protease